MEPNTLTAQGMLCDFAEVSGGKLFVSGAGIGVLGTAAAAAPHPVSMALALLVRIPWGATNHQHRLTIELMSEAEGAPERISINQVLPPGDPPENAGMIVALFNAGRAPQMQVGEETLMPVALPMQGLPLPRLGSYFFSIALDGTEVDRVSFRVNHVMNIPGLARMVGPGIP
jgi:hypothetical protein